MPDQPPEKPSLTSFGRTSLRLANGFARLPVKEKAAFCLAWLLLLMVAPLLRMFAFRRISGILGKPIGPGAWIPLTSGKEEATARIIKRAIRRAARLSPLRSDCLPQIFAGTILCRLFAVPSAGFLGIQLNPGAKMAAHAWLCSGRVPVTGGLSFEQYAAVMCFVRPPSGAAIPTFATGVTAA